MEIKDVKVWKPIGFTENWENVSTSRLDVLLPSWVRKRQTLKDDSKEYVIFMNRLKRQHAIETGIVEKLYDLSEGITETFIKEGFVESYLQHGDTNIPPGQLMAYLQDNFDALDFVFDVVKNDRPITKGFIKELHQLVTKHQDTAEGRDQFGNRLQIPLLKGAFKERDNNPTRADGTRFLYCPPIHVEAEMDKLISILEDLEKRKIKPLTIAAWLHHSFTQIHPFQDGNGRMARLLASLVLIKGGLFPLTVKRHEKKRYIDSLELADQDKPQKLVDYFGEIQKQNIEAALNMRLEVELSQTSMIEIAEILKSKIQNERKEIETEQEKVKARKIKLETNKNIIIGHCGKVLNELKGTLNKKFKENGKFSFPLKLLLFLHDSSDYVKKYADHYSYFYDEFSSAEILDFGINLYNKRNYVLLIPLHYFGHDDSTLAVGAILFKYKEVYEEHTYRHDEIMLDQFILEPLTISLEDNKENVENSYNEIKSYLQDVMTLTLAQITTELN